MKAEEARPAGGLIRAFSGGQNKAASPLRSHDYGAAGGRPAAALHKRPPINQLYPEIDT